MKYVEGFRPMKEIIVAPQKRALYFGCSAANRPGHYVHEGRRVIWDPPPGCPWDLGLMDGGLLRNGKRPDVDDGKVFWTAGGAKSFWYAFFWWDNSGDKRSASNSGIYVEGFGWPAQAEAFEYGCAQYPEVVARQRVPLVLQGR
jgi:hypothetical protein